MTRVVVGLTIAVLITLAAANAAYRMVTHRDAAPANPAWAQDQMEYVAWNDEQWTAWIHDGTFVQLPRDQGRWSRHVNQSIAFVDWDGEPWQAKIDGEEFLLAYRGDWLGSIDRSDAIRYRDWSGSKRLRTVDQLSR